MQEIKHIRFPKNTNVREFNDWVARALPFQNAELRFLFYIPSHLEGNRYISKAIKTTNLNYAPSYLSEPNLVEIEQMEAAVEAHKKLIGETGEKDWVERDELVTEDSPEPEPEEEKPKRRPSRKQKAKPEDVTAAVGDSEVEPSNDGDTPDPLED